MKILILGGTKFFGKEFALFAFKAGHEVTIFSNKCPINKIPLDIKQVRGDRSIYVDLVRMSAQTWDVVVDNICYLPKDAENAVKVFSGRCGLYVFTSTASVYPVLDGASSPYRERHTRMFSLRAFQKENVGYAYGANKLACEKIFLDAFERDKFPISIARFPIVIGPRDPTLRAFGYWLRMTDGKPILAPGAFFSMRYIYSKDAARALEILSSSEKVVGEDFNFGDNHILSLNDFLKLSAKIINRKIEIIPVDSKVAGENDFLFEASPFSALSNFIIETKKAREKLNWESSDINEWMKETINWFFFNYVGPTPKNYSLRKREILLAEQLSGSEKS